MPWLTDLAASHEGRSRRRLLLLCGAERMPSGWSFTEDRVSQ